MAIGALACDPNKDSSHTAIDNANSIVAPSDYCLQHQHKHNELSTKPLPFKLNKNERIKLILCVRSDLGMGKGKVAAQCSHASVGIYSLLRDEHSELLSIWENNGQAKICVRVDNETHMLNVVDTAQRAGLPTFVVRDAGHTQVAPDTLTVAAIGPAPSSVIDQITGNLKLLG